MDFGGKDIGIDLVAYTYEGDYWAIQCKFYSENSTIDKKAVDSFLSTSSNNSRMTNYKQLVSLKDYGYQPQINGDQMLKK